MRHAFVASTQEHLVVIFQRGHHLEKVKAPEHHPFHRCYDGFFTNRFGVDATRNSG
jgi:hypothetical protein